MKRTIFMLVLVGMLPLAACEKKTAITPAQPKAAEMKKPATVGETKEAVAQTPASQPQVASQPVKTGNPVVIMKTSKGEIRIELAPDKAPITVGNFLTYVQSGHYNGTIFHRVIPGFMIQGGGMTANMVPKATNPPIKNEAANGLKNDRGTIAMARTQAPDSATCQFFINVADNTALDYAGSGQEGYAVFGKVIAGMDVVDTIIKVPVRNVGMNANVPVEPVFIESVAAANK
jgi:peptidyl-prolyl cis-trans isomerase A (cyclophilin A)